MLRLAALTREWSFDEMVTEQVPIQINDPEKAGPSPQQEAAFRHLLDQLLS